MNDRKNANTALSNSKVTSYNEQIQILDVTLKLDTPIPDFMEYFENNIDNPASHDEYFNKIIIPWQYFMSHQLYNHAELLWERFINYSYGWENFTNKRIHKGTPYYFAAVTSILARHLENGFLLMHQALEEDKITHSTNTPIGSPAYSFLTLDFDKQDPHFIDKVTEIADFVEKNVDAYRNSRNGELTLSDLKKKFLELDSLQELIFVFVYEMFRIKSTNREIDQRIKQNAFSSLLQVDSIFNLCLMLGNVIKHKNAGKWRFSNHLEFLSQKSGLSLNKKILDGISQSFQNDFSATLTALLNSTYTNDDGIKLTPMEEDLAIAYGFRNYGAHRIEAQPLIYENFDEITSRILNGLFFSIDNLY